MDEALTGSYLKTWGGGGTARKASKQLMGGRFNVKIAALLRANRSAWTEEVRGLNV